MISKIFYIYTGNNGAFYIINLSSFADIKVSLEFYKPLGIKRRILKNGFYVYLCIWSVLRNYLSLMNFKSCIDIQEFISKIINTSFDYNVDNYSSVFISSGRDKVIVHHHNDNYYEKFSFANSYQKSCNEIVIYRTLQSVDSRYYMTSVLRDVKDYSNYCSFKLYNEFNEDRQDTVTSRLLIKALIELFQITPPRSKSVSVICSKIRDNFSDAKPNIRSAVNTVLKNIESTAGGVSVRLGFVHGDFKVWNVQAYENKIHIYDFEESKLDGLPLEDLYNYYIDPRVVTGECTKNISAFINSGFLNEQSSIYLKHLDIQASGHILLLLYILNRLSFYETQGSNYVVQKYLSVLNDIENINS